MNFLKPLLLWIMGLAQTTRFDKNCERDSQAAYQDLCGELDTEFATHISDQAVDHYNEKDASVEGYKRRRKLLSLAQELNVRDDKLITRLEQCDDSDTSELNRMCETAHTYLLQVAKGLADTARSKNVKEFVKNCGEGQARRPRTEPCYQ
jgi:hypothetical protein